MASENKNRLREVLRSFGEVLATVLIAVLAVVLIRSYLIQPFLVSGKSMEPSFSDGDYLLIDELTYRLRAPRRGEVVVFAHDAETFYIKRIVGLPGEIVAIRGGKIRIGNKDGEWRSIEEGYAAPSRTFGDYQVSLGKNEYYVLGDNRNFSYDSRRWGPLASERIVGVARLRLWPVARAMVIGAPAYDEATTTDF